jgi:hypothetical protein
MAAAILLGGAACGGTHATADQQHQTAIASGFGGAVQVACRGSHCRLSASYPFHSKREASFVALQYVFALDTDPGLAAVKTMTLRMMNARMSTTARFDCRLPHHTPSPWHAGVELVQRLCALVVEPS